MAPRPSLRVYRGGQKSVEELARTSKGSDERMLSAFVESSANEVFANVEDEDSLKDLVAQGAITEAEAQRMLARKRMREGGPGERRISLGSEGSSMQVHEAILAGADYATTEQILDDVLQVKRAVFFNWIMEFAGLQWVVQRVNREHLRRNSASFQHPYPVAHKIVHTAAFDVVVGMIMIVNGALIGFQVSLTGTDSSKEEYDIAEHAFTAVFVLEMVTRLLADGWLWLWNGYNVADVMLIFFTGVLPLWVLQPAGVDSVILRALQVLRVLRLIRLVRMVRQVKMFRILWQLVQGVIDSGKTLFWTYVVMGSVLYMFSILCVYQIGRNDSYKGNPIANEFFGDLPRSAVTLFQTMTLDSWASVARPLGVNRMRSYVIFTVAIAVLTLILLNLVTAVIVNNAMYRAERDHELQARRLEEQKMEDIGELRSIFYEIDQDESGMLSKDEFDAAVQSNERVQTKLKLLEISLQETDSLWELMDTGTGEVSIDAFSDLLRAIQGGAKARDSFAIVQRIRRANRKLLVLKREVESRRMHVQKLQKEAGQLQEELTVVLKDVADFVGYVGRCIPAQDVAELEEQDISKQEETWAVSAIERAIQFTLRARPANFDDWAALRDDLDVALRHNLQRSGERRDELQAASRDALSVAEDNTRRAMREAELRALHVGPARSGHASSFGGSEAGGSQPLGLPWDSNNPHHPGWQTWTPSNA